jgi:hypothetical protein
MPNPLHGIFKLLLLVTDKTNKNYAYGKCKHNQQRGTNGGIHDTSCGGEINQALYARMNNKRKMKKKKKKKQDTSCN